MTRYSSHSNNNIIRLLLTILHFSSLNLGKSAHLSTVIDQRASITLIAKQEDGPMIRPVGVDSRSAFLDSHPSINASMEDFEAPREFSPTIPDLPSQHSGFRSGAESEYSERSSRRSHSPPAWRKAGSGWFKQHPNLSPTLSRHESLEPSPEYRTADDESDAERDDYSSAARIPLPESPVKGRSPSTSPEPDQDATEIPQESPRRKLTVVDTTQSDGNKHDVQIDEEETPTRSNYFRFSTRLDVVQKTQPIEDMVMSISSLVSHFTRSKWYTFVYGLSVLSAYMLISNLLAVPRSMPMPDIVKVASLAKSFEPVIYYSERGHAQIGELQETGVAVWDLGESVRQSNMTSAPIIVRQLDSLSDSIKTLAIELTRFFSGVDGDIDNILITMEWAQRELSVISALPESTIGAVWSNTHSMLSRVGLAATGPLAQSVLGMTRQQITRATLERVFNEYLGVLEESINNELTWSIQLFQLFEAIDKQFLNLQRTVIREQDQQERLENDFLGSLWTKVIGVDPSQMRKYEKNKDLLASVRDRTVRNKHVLTDHNQRLLHLKSNLETLRRKLVSPLVRSQNSSTITIDDQIKGLEGTYQQLKSSREVQRRKMMEIVYSAGRREEPARLIGA